MTDTQNQPRRPYQPPAVESEPIELATPIGGSFGFASGPFRDRPPEEQEEQEG